MNDDGCDTTKTKHQKQHQPQQDRQGQHEYRQILLTANKLETIQNKLDSVIDLFVTPIVSNLFSKLCTDCMKLLLRSDFKLDEFRKAEELVWRRVYHDTYRLLKTKRQLVKRQDEYLIETHFMSGIGFYSSLIVQLRIKYKLADVHGLPSPLNLALVPIENLFDDERDVNANNATHKSLSPEDKAIHIVHDDDTSKAPTGTARLWAQHAIYRSLVYMGDLARYLIEYSDYDHRKLAFELYQSAVRFQPDNGLPFNQLATLASGTNYNLDAVCNYMRSCLRPKPFDRAEGNMVKIFELNKKHNDELATRVIKVSEIIAAKEPVAEAESVMKSLIITFLRLVSELWFASEDKLNDDLQNDVVNQTQRFFEILREAIEIEPIVPLATSLYIDEDFRPTPGGPYRLDKPRYVSPTIMYEFCSISIMLVARRQKQSPSDLHAATKTTFNCNNVNDNINDLVNTLALNLLHYATSKCQKMITSKIQELRLSRQEPPLPPPPPPPSDRSLSFKPASEWSLRNSSPMSSDATSRRALSRLRQRKAAANYSDEKSRSRSSATLAKDDDDDSDLSELEETALSTIDALDISSEMSEEAEYQAVDLINLDSSSDDDALMRESINRTLLSKPLLRPTRSQNYEKQDRKTNRARIEPCNSLPVPDLLTGDIAEMSFKTNATVYNDHFGTPSELCGEHQMASEQSLVESTLAYLYNQTYLPTIKVYFDWLLSNGAIIDSNPESFTGYQLELANTVDLLVELEKVIELNDMNFECDDRVDLYKHAYKGPEWSQKYPLSCDFPFINLELLKSVHDSNIDFKLKRELDNAESGFVTVQCIKGFSDALTMFLRNKIDEC